MTIHIHGTILTQYGVAANNRGETEGNLTTLQKLLWKGETHSTVSAEAIRFAIRSYFQEMYEMSGDEAYLTNRYWKPTPEGGDHAWRDPAFSEERFIDDDVFGYMDAKAPAAEQHEVLEDEENGKKTRSRGAVKGTTRARRGALEVSRAVSLDPYVGETSFNAKGGQKGSTSLYATEVHATAYQYSFSLTPGYLAVSKRASLVVDAIAALNSVGGNQSRYLFDFSPAAAILRVTHDPAPRIMFAFEGGSHPRPNLKKLVDLVRSGDIETNNLILGGISAEWEETQQLLEAGATVCPGVKEAFQRAKERL